VPGTGGYLPDFSAFGRWGRADRDFAGQYCPYRARREAVALAGRDHSPDDYKALRKDVGSAVEVFLKVHVYAGAHTRHPAPAGVRSI
jgi:hypothetical protein